MLCVTLNLSDGSRLNSVHRVRAKEREIKPERRLGYPRVLTLHALRNLSDGSRLNSVHRVRAKERQVKPERRLGYPRLLTLHAMRNLNDDGRLSTTVPAAGTERNSQGQRTVRDVLSSCRHSTNHAYPALSSS